jgi:hypothetical protein
MTAKVACPANAKEAEQQLRGLIATCPPKYQALVLAVRNALRKRFPTADELVYDYPGNLLMAYSPTERGSDAIVSFSTRANGLALNFTYGATLSDPKNILFGSAKQNRYIPLESVKALTRPEVRTLIAAAIDQAKIPLREEGRGTLIIKSRMARKIPKRRLQHL